MTAALPNLSRQATNSQSLSEALDLAAQGIFVFPVRLVWIGLKRRKIPCIKNWRHRASTDPAVIWSWCAEFPGRRWGIELEHSGLVIVDCDQHGGPDGVATFEELGPVQSGPVISTPSGGEHRPYLQPGGIASAVPWRPGIDLLGPGRFVVAYASFDLSAVPVLPEIFRTTERPEEKPPVQTHTFSLQVQRDNELPTEIYRELIIRAMPLGSSIMRRHQRWAGSILRCLIAHTDGRNGALVRAIIQFRPIIEQNLISAASVRKLLLMACAANGYLGKVGVKQVEAIIASVSVPPEERSGVFSTEPDQGKAL